jgi:hypothetical protein
MPFVPFSLQAIKSLLLQKLQPALVSFEFFTRALRLESVDHEIVLFEVVKKSHPA